MANEDNKILEIKDLCKSYQYSAKVISKMGGTLKGRVGNPDLLVLFTDTISHKMLKNAMNEIKGQKTKVARCRSGSLSALRETLELHRAGA